MEDTIVNNGITYKRVPTEPVEPEYPDAAKWAEGEKDRNYYCIDTFGEPRCIRNEGSTYDKTAFHTANAFTTEQAAQEQADKDALARRIQRWRDTHDPVELDWWDISQDKYHWRYNYCQKDLVVIYTSDYREPNVTYFSSDELSYQCISEFGNEIKRVFYGVVKEEEKWI